MPLPIPFLLGLTLGAGAVVFAKNPKVTKYASQTKEAVKTKAKRVAKSTKKTASCVASKISKVCEDE